MRKTLLLTRGLPGSGKSTWATHFLQQHPTWKRVNRDSLRDMLDAGSWSEAREKHIRQAELLLVQYCYAQGFNVLVDDTNLSPSAMAMWQECATHMGMTLQIQDFTGVPLETCIKQDLLRPCSVGEQVIRRMARQYLSRPPVASPVHDENLPKALLCDIDGTLALINGRNPYDASRCEEDHLNLPVADLVKRYAGAGFALLLVSGRTDTYRPQTSAWLETHEIPYQALWMRKAGDNRRDYIIKREIYEEHIAGQYTIHLVLDDRSQCVDLWRALGLPCFQVADGDF